MSVSISLMLIALIGVQAYFMPAIFKDFIRHKDYMYLICLVGIIGTNFATVGLLVGVMSMLFTGGGM